MHKYRLLNWIFYCHYLRGEKTVGVSVGLLANFCPHQPTRNIISRRVDSAPDTRQATLISCIVVGGPLERNVLAGSFFEYQKVISLG